MKRIKGDDCIGGIWACRMLDTLRKDVVFLHILDTLPYTKKGVMSCPIEHIMRWKIDIGHAFYI